MLVRTHPHKAALRKRFHVQQAQTNGFYVLQVKSITLLSPDKQLKLDCTAMASSEQRCVTDLLAEKLPVPLTDRWLITAAQINLHYPPGPGKVRPKVVTVEVTRKARLNPHKFDATLQAQLERYRVSLDKNLTSYFRSSLGSARRVRVIDALSSQGNVVRRRHVQRINGYDL